MNPILIILIFLIGIIIWFICASLYKPIGEKINKIINNSINAMKDENEEEQGEWKENREDEEES